MFVLSLLQSLTGSFNHFDLEEAYKQGYTSIVSIPDGKLWSFRQRKEKTIKDGG